jgi:DNA helicase-2/ATP-dependent DNA helicase PcrA
MTRTVIERADPQPVADADADALLLRLNPAQQCAVAHGDAPLLVVAGAGTGKTTTLAARVARLLRDGADPQRLLLLTFSRRAAQQMAHRAGLMLREALGLRAAQAPPALPWAGTFHAIGARLLRELAPAVGLPADFSVLDRADAQDLMALARSARGQAELPRRFPMAPTCLAIASRAVNSDQALHAVLTTHYPWCLPWEAELRALFSDFAARKQQQHLLDFDDLLLAWADAMAVPEVAHALGGRFDHVLVDEVQDCNRLQARILDGLRPDGHGLTLVGDDAQAIYAFRGADRQLMLDFRARHAGRAQVITLEQNYRSTPAILAAANALIAEARDALPRSLHSQTAAGPRPRLVRVADEAAQAAWVADEVLLLREQGLALKQQAVLFRTATHSAALELELVRRRIPFVKFGGLRFLESAHVKDLLALLRWARNPRHALAAQRCARLVPGMGPAAVRRLLAALQEADDPAQVLRSHAPPPAAREGWPALVTLWQALHAGTLPWPEAFDAALDWYRPQLQRLHEDASVRLADLTQLRQAARSQPDAQRFLAELALDPPQASSDLAGPPHRDEDWLVLSTIHSAKGQEWSAVHVLAAVDGCMPADMATGDAEQIEEERRLLYVAVTRARRHLNLLAPQRFHLTQQARHGDRHVYALPSRFLTPAVLACMDEAGGPLLPHDLPGLGLPAGSADLATRLRGRWS